MYIYGLKCVGMDTLGGGKMSLYSHKLFTSITGAEDYMSEFRNKCTSDKFIVSIEDNDLLVLKIIKYELEDNNDTRD